MALSTTTPLLLKTPGKTRAVSAFAMKRDARDRNYNGGGGGRLVDENMIVLRKRIHEMKMVERNYEPPAEWMDWEKNCYANYDAIICDAMGVLQSGLMNTRPSLTLGLVGLVALSLPVSSAAVLIHLSELTKAVLAGIHFS